MNDLIVKTNKQNFLALDNIQMPYIIIAGCYFAGVPYEAIGGIYLAMGLLPKYFH